MIELLSDYHVLVVVSNKNEFEFELFNSDKVKEIEIEELKEIVLKGLKE